MDILNVTKDYADCRSGGAVTEPTGGTWVSAIAIYLGATEPVNGSWIQALCEQEGVTQSVNGSWVQALAESYGLTEPLNGSWWFAIADYQCNAGPKPPPPFIWNLDTRRWNLETRTWDNGVVPSLDPDAQAFLTATGISDNTQELAVNQLVLDLKAAAIWNKMTAVWPFVGGTATTHKYNLIDPQDTDAAYRMTFNGIFSHGPNGAAAGGTSSDYGNTHWIPNAQTFTNGVHWSANIYADGGGTNYNMGISQSGDWALINAFIGATDYWQAGTGGYLTHNGDSSFDWVAGTSNGTNFRALYDDGVQVTSDTNGGINTAQTIPAYAWAVNAGGTPTGSSRDIMNFITIGEYLDATEMSALYTAVTNFNTTLGR